ncbi:hypothetical protein EDD28_2418 [Salana multivorans]|uniref:Uncharacterized protein n=1 Tax=Salana multivorans TaxID=120377 RepID=A0A3N2DDE6_9MICO|nr:hypothetical protein [Salana multivorans]ROR97809.1 hypothetical protein EDD28_2418 [Salana multivorans]
MTWFKVDDRLWSHPKWLATPPAARGLWVTAGSWSAHQEQDGRVPYATLRILGHSLGHARALVHSGLWREIEGGFEFHGWAEFQPTSAEVRAKRALRAEAGRKGGLASGRSRREANASPGLEANGNPVPSRPGPVTPNGVTVSPRRKPERPLPDDWTPDEGHRRRAAELGLDLDATAEAFRNHAATNDRRARDWNAAFRSWLTKAAEYAARDSARGRRPSDRQADILRREMDAAIAWDAQREHDQPKEITS